jgi:hypothetical protein
MKLKGQHMTMMMYVPLPCWHAVQIANKPYIHRQATSKNIFDNIPALAKPTCSELRDELAVFLSVQTQNMSTMSLHGGMIGERCTPAYTGWRLTTYLSQVTRLMLIYISYLTDIFPIISSNIC